MIFPEHVPRDALEGIHPYINKVIVSFNISWIGKGREKSEELDSFLKEEQTLQR